MKRKQFAEEQIIGIRKEAEAGAVMTEFCRKHGLSNAIYYARKAKYGGLDASQAKRLRALEDESAKRKRLLADAIVDIAGLKDLLARGVVRGRQAGGGRAVAGWARDERAARLRRDRGRPDEHALPLLS